MPKKKVDLKIKNLSVSLPKITIHPNLPSLCFSMVVVGKSGCGKSNCLCNLILKYKKWFNENLYIFQKSPCETIKKNLIDNQKINGIRFKNIIDKKGNNILEEIIKSQKEYIKKGEMPPYVLILFDDYYDNEILKRHSVLTDLYSLSRHYNISIINVVHSYTLLNSNLRRMAKYFIIFKMTNEDEKKKMCYELCNCLDMNEKEFLDVYKDITDIKHNFMLIDCINGKYYRNFDKY